MLRALLVSGFLLGFAACLPGAELADDVVYECRWTTGPIKIDGRADDLAWSQAVEIDDFIVGWVKPPRPAKTRTKARLLWNAQGIYFFAEMEDHDLYADIKEHDGPIWNNDVFELFFKPSTEKLAYYEFEISALNTVFDMYLGSRGSGMLERWLTNGTFHLQTAVERRGTLNDETDRDEGWSVEGFIPWDDFARTGGAPRADEQWKFSLCRYDYSVDFESPELSSISRYKSANYHRYEDYATLRFLGPAKP